jgi:hypothetical protein
MPSMPSDPRNTGRGLRDIQHHIALAQSFAAGTTYESFKDDMLRLCAVDLLPRNHLRGLTALARGTEGAAPRD